MLFLLLLPPPPPLLNYHYCCCIYKFSTTQTPSPIHPSVRPSVDPPVRPSVRPSVQLFTEEQDSRNRIVWTAGSAQMSNETQKHMRYTTSIELSLRAIASITNRNTLPEYMSVLIGSSMLQSTSTFNQSIVETQSVTPSLPLSYSHSLSHHQSISARANLTPITQ